LKESYQRHQKKYYIPIMRIQRGVFRQSAIGVFLISNTLAEFDSSIFKVAYGLSRLQSQERGQK
jgi:hypothetical protein